MKLIFKLTVALTQRDILIEEDSLPDIQESSTILHFLILNLIHVLLKIIINLKLKTEKFFK